MTAPPTWLATGEPGPLPEAKRRWRRADYLTKTLASIQKIMAEDMLQTGIAARSGFLQAHERGSKWSSLYCCSLPSLRLPAYQSSPPFTVCSSWLRWPRHRTAALPRSHLAPGAHLRRPRRPAAIFSWVTPGTPIVIIYDTGGWQAGPLTLPAELTVTRQGLTAAAMVLLRAAASLGLVVLLVKTTCWPALTKALQSLGIPAVFVMVLELAYRYLFLFMLLLTDYLLGRRSRLVGGETPRAGLEWIGGTLGGFLRLAGEYGQEIAAAMQARGFNGEIQALPVRRPGLRDAALLALAASICFIMLGGARIGHINGI
jgi:cobalt/nickel transport system permease protein